MMWSLMQVAAISISSLRTVELLKIYEIVTVKLLQTTILLILAVNLSSHQGTLTEGKSYIVDFLVKMACVVKKYKEI